MATTEFPTHASAAGADAVIRSLIAELSVEFKRVTQQAQTIQGFYVLCIVATVAGLLIR